MEMIDYSTVVALVVDDDPIMRSILRECLTHLGCRTILEANDGMVAQRILMERSDVQIVITDIIMPRLDGLGLVAWARTDCPGPVWVILSALDRFDKAVEAIRLGAFDFLAKPLRTEELEVAVRNAIRHYRLLRERSRLNAELERQVDELRSKSELLRRDLERAEIIQRALLPHRPPNVEGIRMEAVYRPGNYVGGDLYDVIRLDNRHVAFYVADATGHGVTAAMLSVLFKEQLDLMEEGRPRAPSAVLRDSNRALVEALHAPGLFLTVFYGIVDTQDNTLTVASAGHPPALYKSADGTSRLLPRTGPALGLTGDARFAEHQIPMNSGDALFTYTDGFLEANGGEAAQRVWTLLESRPFESQQLFSDMLLELGQTMPRPQHDEVDDLTALLIVNADGESRFDNGSAEARELASTIPTDSVVYCGESGDTWYLALRGRGTWKHSEVLYETGRAILEEHHPVVLHLGDCEYLDSTMLGTVHELVSRGNVRVQGVRPPVEALFQELSMERVLRAISQGDLPQDLQPIAHDAAQTQIRSRIQNAHEALSSISSSNEARFRDVLNAIR